jgi:ABC-type hemin transport system ATPase subunit
MNDIKSFTITVSIPKGILRLGREGITKYLNDLKSGEHAVYCARGMLVGSQGAGKTSLLLRLRGETAPDPPSTRGLDVHINVFNIDQGKLEGQYACILS